MPAREPVDLILLAAGAARRFGAAKLLAGLDGGTVLGVSLRTALAAPVRSVRVVVGCRAEAVTEEARRVAAGLGQQERLQVVAAEDWAEGLAASLRAGLRALPSDAEGAFIALGDMPWVPAAIYPALLTALGEVHDAAAPYLLPPWRGKEGSRLAEQGGTDEGAARASAPIDALADDRSPDHPLSLPTRSASGPLPSSPARGEGGRRGHPVLVRRALFPELAALSGDQGARRVLDRLGPALALVPTDDPGVLQDVDTPADLARAAAG